MTKRAYSLSNKSCKNKVFLYALNKWTKWIYTWLKLLNSQIFSLTDLQNELTKIQFSINQCSKQMFSNKALKVVATSKGGRGPK